MRKIFVAFVFIGFSVLLTFTGCAQDPYREYASSGLEVKELPFDYKEENSYTFGFNKAEIFTDHQGYLKYGFSLDYTANYFQSNNLLVVVVSCCSSDEMEFSEILQKDGKLYPAFYRKKIKAGEPVTEDFIVLSFCAEIPKGEGYSLGEIIYKYR